MALYANRFDPQSAAEKAVSVIGSGYDLATDIRLSGCKPGPSGSSLIELDRGRSKDLVLPGGVVVPNVSASIKCDKGERTRFRSDVLSFNQMSEQFNQELSLSGKIPSGLFNTMFGFRGCWQKDAAATRSLTLDGWFITLYNIELARSQIILSDRVKKEVPASWDPVVLAECMNKASTAKNPRQKRRDRWRLGKKLQRSFELMDARGQTIDKIGSDKDRFASE